MNSRVKISLVGVMVPLVIALIVLTASLAGAQDPGDLIIQKTVYDAQGQPVTGAAIAGEELFYHVTVANHNEWVSAEGVLVTDTLPSNVQFILATGGDCDWGPNSTWPEWVECYLGDISPNDTASFDIKVRVPADLVVEMPNGTDDIENYAEVIGDVDGDPVYDDTLLGTFVEDEADLQVVKMSKPDTHVLAGELFTYTIFVENLGPSYARDVSIRDEILSSGAFSVVDVVEDPDRSDACFVAPEEGIPQGPGETIECDLAEPLEPKDIETRGRWVIQVVLRANETQDVNNLVQVFTDPVYGTPDPDLSNNQAEDFISVEAVADLWIDKRYEGEGGPVAGDQLTFYLDVGNAGPSTAQNVVLEDLLPAGVTVLGVSSDNGASCTTGTPGDPFAPLICNLGALAPGASTTVQIDVRIDPGYVDPTLPWFEYGYRKLENDAWVHSDTFDADNGDNRDHVILDVSTWSNVWVWKLGPDSVQAGEEIDYMIRVRNLGPSTLRNFHFVDALPEQVTFLDYAVEQGTGTCFYYADGHATHCYLDDIAPGAVRALHLYGEVSPSATQGFTNTIVGAFADSDFGVISDPAQAEWYTGVSTAADLAIEKTSDPVKVYPGEQIAYHINVTNNGPSDAQSVVVSDTLDSGVQYQIDTDSCVEGPAGTLTCGLGTIPAGQSRGFDVHVLVLSNTPPGEIVNEATVQSETEDPNTGDNSATASTLVLTSVAADLSLTKSAPPFALAGSPIQFTLSITNPDGPLAATNVVVEDLLPEGVTVTSVTATQGSCTTGTPGAVPLRCDLGSLGVGSWATVTIWARIAPSYLGPLENDAEVYSDLFDPNNGNNRDSVIVRVLANSALFLKKACGPDYQVLAGEKLQYDILIRNDGPSTAHNLQLWDRLPDDVTFLGYEILPGGGECFYTPQLPVMHGGPGQGLHCYLGDVEPNDTRILYVKVRVNPDAEGLMTNTVTDWAADSPVWMELPPTSRYCSNDVINEADLSIWKTSDPFKVFAGEQVRYDIEVTNNGPGNAYGVVVSDTLPAEVEYELDTGNCELLTVTDTVFLGSSQPGDYLLDNGGSVGGELFSIDVAGTSASLIGYMTGGFLATEIEYDNLAAKLYAMEAADYTGLHTIDPTTGATIGAVNIDAPDSLKGMEFVGSTLYGAPGGHDDDPSYLVTVDPDTGDVYPIDETGWDVPISGLAYDEATETMYGVTAGDQEAYLVTIDLSTGHATEVDEIVVGGSQLLDKVGSIEFGPDGRLYGGLTRYADFYPEWLIEIDPATAEATPLFDTGFSITGLTLAELETPSGVVCSLGDLAPGETRTFSVFGRVRPDAEPGQTVSNKVEVSSDTEDWYEYNDSASAPNYIMGKADLKVTKFGKPDGEVRADEELEYTVIVDNLGPGYAHDVVLYDVLASDGHFHLDWDWDGPANCTEQWDYNGMETVRLTCRLMQPLPVLSPWNEGRWTLKVSVHADERQSINNVARVTSSDLDPDLSNNEAVVEHDVTAVADLNVSKSARGKVATGCGGAWAWSTDEVTAGQDLEYTLTVWNYGPSRAENVVLEDWGISPLLEITDVEWPLGDSCVTTELGEVGDTNRRLTCNLGTLYDYNSAQVTIYAHVPSDVAEGTLLVNDVRVYSDVFDDDNGDNLRTNQTTVSAWADLEVEKTQEPPIALPTLELTYTITVTNLGPSDAYGAILSDTIPSEIVNVSWECCASDGGRCQVPFEPTCPEGPCPPPDLVFDQLDVPAGERAVYTILGTLTACAPVTNTVEVIAPPSLLNPGFDIDPCPDNSSSAVVNEPECTFVPLVLKNFDATDFD